ncbi:hypothetical protein ILYODFUR_010439 [Ilyodon furcidens]|uniref:Interleukin n=1 Tax=Ilyodon furcidens TaxID=33524 RepID=A0ABV0SX90_9TELE
MTATQGQNDSEFYTPKPTETKCFKSALECIYKELNGTARTECEDPNHRIDEGLESLEIKIDDLNLTTNLPECACELWTQTSFSEFLDNYKSLLQRENAAAGK